MAKIRLERRTPSIVLQLFGAFGMVVAAGCGSSDSGGKKDSAVTPTEAGPRLDTGPGPDLIQPRYDVQPTETPVQQPEAGIDVTPPIDTTKLDTPKLDVQPPPIEVGSPDRPETPRPEVNPTEAGTGGVGGGTGAGGTAGGTGTGTGGAAGGTGTGTGGAAGGTVIGTGGTAGTTTGEGGAAGTTTAEGGAAGTTTGEGGAAGTTAAGGATGGTTTGTGGTTTGAGGSTTVLIPELTIAPASLDFGPLNCADGNPASALTTVSLRSTGDGILTISNRAFTGSSASAYSTPLTIPTVVNAGANTSTTINLSANSQATALTAALNLTTNEASGGKAIPLTALVHGSTLAWNVEGLVDNVLALGGTQPGNQLRGAFSVTNTGDTAAVFTLGVSSTSCENAFAICPENTLVGCPAASTQYTLAAGATLPTKWLVFTAPDVEQGATKDCNDGVVTMTIPDKTHACNSPANWGVTGSSGSNAPEITLLPTPPYADYPTNIVGLGGSSTNITLAAACGASPADQTVSIKNVGYNTIYRLCNETTVDDSRFTVTGCNGTASTDCIPIAPGDAAVIQIATTGTTTHPFPQNATGPYSGGYFTLQLYSNDYCNAEIGRERFNLVATPLGDNLTFTGLNGDGELAIGAVPLNPSGPTPAKDQNITVRNIGNLYPTTLTGNPGTDAHVTLSITDDAADMFDIVDAADDGTLDLTLPAKASATSLTIRYKGPVGGVIRPEDTATLHWAVAETNTCMGTTAPGTLAGDIPVTASTTAAYSYRISDEGRTPNFGGIFCGATADPEHLEVKNVGDSDTLLRLTSYTFSNTYYDVDPPGKCTGTGFTTNCGCTANWQCSSGSCGANGVCLGRCRTDLSTPACNITLAQNATTFFTIKPKMMQPTWIESSLDLDSSPKQFQTTLSISGTVAGGPAGSPTSINISQQFTENARGLLINTASISQLNWAFPDVLFPAPSSAVASSINITGGNVAAKVWVDVPASGIYNQYFSVDPAAFSPGPDALIGTRAFSAMFGPFNSCVASINFFAETTAGSTLTITPDFGTSRAPQSLAPTTANGNGAQVGICGSTQGTLVSKAAYCDGTNPCGGTVIGLGDVTAKFDNNGCSSTN